MKNSNASVHQQVLKFRGVRINAICQFESDLVWLKEFLYPWYEFTQGDADIEVSLVFDKPKFDQLLSYEATGNECSAYIQDANILSFDKITVPRIDNILFNPQSQLFVIIDSYRVTLLGGRYDVLARKALLKTVREIVMSHVHETGGRFLHASCCTLNEMGLVMSGPSNSGKTSLLLYMLLNSEFQFVTGDRLLIDQGCGIGMPTIISIRNGTLGLFPEFRSEIESRCYGLPLTVAECESDNQQYELFVKPDKVLLSSKQLSEILTKTHCIQTSIRGLIFPRVDPTVDGWKITPLGRQSCKQKLRNSLFGNINPRNLSKAFTLIQPDLSQRNIISDNEFRAQLSESLPACECVLGINAFENEQLYKEIYNWLENPF